MSARSKRATHNAAGVVAAGTVAQVVGLLQRLDDCPPDDCISFDDYVTVMRTIEAEARRRRENAERMRKQARCEQVRCECGEVTGVPCEWSGPASATAVVEWMPPQHRASHAAAGNGGSYPHNGARRLRVEAETCAPMVRADQEG